MKLEHWPLKIAFGVMAALIALSDIFAIRENTSSTVLLMLGLMLIWEALSDREMLNREREMILREMNERRPGRDHSDEESE